MTADIITRNLIYYSEDGRVDAFSMDSLSYWAEGNYLDTFLRDDSSDYIIIDLLSGFSESENYFFAPYARDSFGEYSDNGDTIYIGAYSGNDSLDAPWQDNVSMYGGEGDDQLSAWFSADPTEAWEGGPVNMQGGDGADVFRSASFNGGTIVVTDYETGVDQIMVMDESGAWEALDLSQTGPGARFTAEETDTGVVLTIHHYDDGHSRDVSTIVLGNLDLSDLGIGTDSGSLLSGTVGRDNIRNGFGTGLTDRIDTIDAGAGNDNIRLDTSNDVILAGAGHDFVLVRGSGNIIDGGAGNDQILTRWGGNTVNGGDGNDRITVDLRSGGEFSLAGGYGEDTFVFTNAQAKAATYTEITDFDVFNDTLIIGGVEIDFSNLPDNFEVTDNGTSMLLEFGRNDSILVTFDIYPM